MSLVPLILAMGASQMVLYAQDPSTLELARLLASDTTRQRGVARVVASGNNIIPILLSWTKSPPPQVDQNELYIGLADAFGQLKTKEAIPFLIKNISLQRWRELNTWLKTAQVIEERLPAVAALVRIGKDASKALISEYQTLVAEDRLAAIFVVSMIQDPEARTFLASVMGQANLERYWAEEGLKRLEGRK